mmetsp:Transcript_3949/g.7578  ORF Transcript_3949/g.7578 Transcript_3949/m.7578 type:complete len:343 (-) Transcript_3949:164-1192(-)
MTSGLSDPEQAEDSSVSSQGSKEAMMVDDSDMAIRRSSSAIKTAVQNAVCLLLFMFFGPSLIMVNKYILRDIGFNFPITHTCYTSLFCTVTLWTYVYAFGIKLKHSPVVTRNFYMTNIMPIGFLQGATIVLGMTSYLFLTVSFVQMLKASTPVMIVLFLRVFNLAEPTFKILAAVSIICFGTVLSSYGEINFSLIGVTSMVSGQVAEALRLVFTQKLLKNLKFDVVESLCYVTPAATFWVFIAALLLEYPRMSWRTLSLVNDNLYIFFIAGVLAVGVNTINSVVIKFTSSLMMKLLATARNASLVIFNVIFMGEAVTGLQFVGYSISLAGFMMYNYYRKKST